MIESFKRTDPSMKFLKRFTIRKKEDIRLFARGIWSPTVRDWRDVIEDYIRISRIRLGNKWEMFKLQWWILEDIINFVKINDQCKEKLNELEKQRGKEEAPNDLEEQIETIREDLFSQEFLLSVLKEVMDGVVWRYFKYNRALLYILADKGPSGPLRADPGLINSIYELVEIFNRPGDVAILNDITNFLKVGDITTIKEDGSIEFVEVKSGKGRNSRITRQKERMQEIVEFFNTGMSEYDGNKIRIVVSPIKQRNYLPLLLNAIKSAEAKGHYSEMIGDYMILECMDPIKISDSKTVIEYFESRHKSVRERWERNKDIILPCFATDKLGFSKNFAPYTIFPFSDEVCADIICGRFVIHTLINYSEVMRIFEKEGWQIIDSMLFKKPDELEKMDISRVSLITVSKGGLRIEIPPSMIGRLHFEFLSPRTLINEFERVLKEGPKKDAELNLVSYIDDETAWN